MKLAEQYQVPDELGLGKYLNINKKKVGQWRS